jgi:hypothetical protein
MPTKIPTKLIFGIRTSQATRLIVSDGPTSTPVPLLVTTRDKPGQACIPCEGGVWTVDLPLGDHVVSIEISNEDDWFDETLRFSVNPSASIVSLGPQGAIPVPSIASWSVMEGSTNEGGGSNPKDPWPPPGVASLFTLNDNQWLTDTLRSKREQILLFRDGPVLRRAPKEV